MTSAQTAIQELQDAANAETKSSAGDKYETGRAMAQREVDMLGHQLKEAEKLHLKLKGLSNVRSEGKVIPGSLVNTSSGDFYIAISMGLVTRDQMEYFIVSSDSPIGRELLGKRKGDSFVWNSRSGTILSIE